MARDSEYDIHETANPAFHTFDAAHQSSSLTILSSKNLTNGSAIATSVDEMEADSIATHISTQASNLAPVPLSQDSIDESKLKGDISPNQGTTAVTTEDNCHVIKGITPAEIGLPAVDDLEGLTSVGETAGTIYLSIANIDAPTEAVTCGAGLAANSNDGTISDVTFLRESSEVAAEAPMAQFRASEQSAVVKNADAGSTCNLTVALIIANITIDSKRNCGDFIPNPRNIIVTSLVVNGSNF